MLREQNIPIEEISTLELSHNLDIPYLESLGTDLEFISKTTDREFRL